MIIEVHGVNCLVRKSKRKLDKKEGGETVYEVDLSRPVKINGVEISEGHGFGYVSHAKSAASLKAALRAAANNGQDALHSYTRVVVKK